MQIDARNVELQDLLKNLKEILAAHRGCEIDMKILVTPVSYTKKVKAFVSMSGCSTEIDREDDYYIIHVRGSICCA